MREHFLGEKKATRKFPDLQYMVFHTKHVEIVQQSVLLWQHVIVYKWWGAVLETNSRSHIASSYNDAGLFFLLSDHWHGYKKYATQCLVFKSLSHLSAIIQSVNSKPRMFQQWVEVAHCLSRSILSCITSLQAWLSAVVVDASVPNQPQTQDSLVDFQKGFWQQGRYTQKRRHAWVWSKVVSAERYSGSQYHTHGKKLLWMQTFSKTQTPKFNFPQTFPTIQ